MPVRYAQLHGDDESLEVCGIHRPHRMTYEQQALLLLARLGVGNDTESGHDFTGVDWRKLVTSSFAQGVTAIAVDGLQKLYECKHPTKCIL